jgi:hypothetical protein
MLESEDAAARTRQISRELAPADIDSKDGVTKGWTDILAGLDRVMAERS